MFRFSHNAGRWPAAKRWTLLAGIAAAVTWECTAAVRLAIVESWTDSEDIGQVERAIELEPTNPEPQYRLAGLLASREDPIQPTTITLLRAATELNPAASRYWAGLARACYFAGEQACADTAFERATRLAPMRPQLSLEAGTYYANSSQYHKAWTTFRTLLRTSPEFGPKVFELMGAVFDPPTVWRNLVSLQSADVKAAYLNQLAHDQEFTFAGLYWTAMIRSGEVPTADAAKPYLQKLVAAQRFEQAVSAWQDLVRLQVLAPPDGAPANLVFNGRFGRPTLNVGFDWQTRDEDFVALTWPDRVAEEKALRIDFTVPHNAEDEPLFQFVPVTPGRAYVLTAEMRSEAITSDSGPQLRVEDAICPPCLDVATVGVIGTTPWRQQRLIFSAGPRTSILRLSVSRARSRTFPMDISGTLWLRDVSIQRADKTQSEPTEHSDND